MDNRNIKLFALFIIELMIFFPVLTAFAFNINQPTYDITHERVIINWSTSILTNASVVYRLQSESSDQEREVSDSEYKREHSAILTEVIPGERHFFRIFAWSTGDRPILERFTGSFTVPDDNPPPQVYGLRIEELNEDQVEIVWDEYDKNVVSDFSRYIIYRDDEEIARTTRANYVDDKIEGLTTYIYNIAGFDDTGNIGPMSSGLIVTTLPPDLTPPHLHNIKVIGVSNVSAIVYWETDKESNSKVYYGEHPGSQMSRTVSGLHLNHTVTLTGLNDGSRYYYIISSCDKRNNCRNSSEHSFIAGGDTTPPTLSNIKIPDITNSNVLPVSGSTKEITRILIYVNDYNVPKAVTLSDISGDFSTRVYLDTSISENKILIKAQDAAGNTAEQEFTIDVDTTKPVVSINELPVLSNSSSVSFDGNVSEDVTLNIYVTGEPDEKIKTPSMVADLENSHLTSDTVRLDWKTNNASERVDYYRIYRNGVIVGTSRSNSFSDCVQSNTRYSYQVAAVNSNCDEGGLSSTVSVITPDGSNCTMPQRDFEDNCRNEVPKRTSRINQGSFRQTIPLTEGNNEIRLEFLDVANNSVVISASIIYDSKSPTIVWHNLQEITPAYETEVTVKGRVDEPATVKITVNDDETFIGITDDEGNFSIDVDLYKITYYDPDLQTRTGYPTGQVVRDLTGYASGDDVIDDDYRRYLSSQLGPDVETTSLRVVADDGVYINKIEIIAIDRVNKESSTVTGDVEYRMCSYGSWWGVTLTNPQPSMLIPRHILNGIAQISFNYELEWLGGTQYDEEIPRPRIDFNWRDIAPVDRDDWDTDWFSRPRVIADPTTNNTKGYILIQSRTQNRAVSDTARYRRDLARAVEENATENLTTTLKMEQEISKHRTNSTWDKNCIISQFGCVRLPLQLEITFTDPVYKSNTDNILGYSSSTQSGRTVQRQCIDMEIAIDKRVDVDLIPESFLKSAISSLDNAIKLIDNVLKPINQVKEYVLYACLGSWVVMYVKALDKRYTCEFKGALSIFTGTGFNPIIAEQGLCHYFYGDPEKLDDDDDNKKKAEECLKCTSKVKSYQHYTEIMQNLCDRLACPSAPSFMSYVRQVNQKTTSQVNLNFKKDNTSSEYQSIILNQRSDCYGLEPTFEMVEEQYKNWLEFKKDPSAFTITNPDTTSKGVIKKEGNVDDRKADQINGTPQQNLTCLDPHYSNPKCCAVEYMRVYDSACGLSMPSRGVLFDEMKESYCVAGSFAGTPNETLYKQCTTPGRRLWGAITGICEANPGLQGQIIKSDATYSTDAVDIWVPSERFSRATTPDTSKPKSDPGIIVYETQEIRGGDPAGGTDTVYHNNECPISLRPHDERNIFYRVMPTGENDEQGNPMYLIHRGMILKNIGIADSIINTAQNSFTDPTGDTPVGSSMVFRPLGPPMRESMFKLKSGETIPADTQIDDIKNTQGYKDFKKDMEHCANKQDYTKSVASEINLAADDVVKFIIDKSVDNDDKSISDFIGAFTETSTFKKIDLQKVLESGLVSNSTGVFNKSRLEHNKVGITTYARRAIKQNIESEMQLTDAIVERTYKQIQAAMGMGDKEIIVDPTSGFLRSVQCLCLPGITGYLKLWRAIMVAVKACLQTILITGDGNPGVCRAVLTQYICDLIYDLVRCFANKYNTGFQRDYGVTNFPGNILGTLTSAGRDVQRSIAGRYGESGFFRAMFAERQLVHALCLWAFTGTFDFDFNAMVEGEYGDVPVDSQGLLAPCQRRYISYDERTGQATHNYYFGLGLIAGADLTYNVRLICSDGWDCDYGMGMEKCDCDEKGVQRRGIALSGSPGTLSRYEIVETEFDDMIKDDIRYDKVVLEYNYMDRNRQRVTQNVTCDIRQVGGAAPGFCQFDVGRGIYRCSVDVGHESYVQLGAFSDPKENYPYWRPGDVLRLNIDVRQKLPQTLSCNTPESCSETRYLSIELNDHLGNSILRPLESGSYRPLLVDGMMTYSLPSMPITISENHLRGSGPANLRCTVEDDQFHVTGCTGNLPTTSSLVQISINDDDAKYKFGCKFNNADVDFNLSSGGECILDNNTVGQCICKSDSNEITVSLTTKTDGGRNIKSGTSVNIKPAGVIESQQSGLCGGKNEVKWNGVIRVYKSVGEGGGLYGISNDVETYMGSSQEQAFSITINCREDAHGVGVDSEVLTYAGLVNEIKSGEIVFSDSLVELTNGTAHQITLKSTRDLNDVFYKINDPFGQTIKSANFRSQTTQKDWIIREPWTPDKLGMHNIEIFVRPGPPETAAYSRTYSINVTG
jgi:hypothetical protein